LSSGGGALRCGRNGEGKRVFTFTVVHFYRW
jgi:hypothetical protein